MPQKIEQVRQRIIRLQADVKKLQAAVQAAEQELPSRRTALLQAYQSCQSIANKAISLGSTAQHHEQILLASPADILAFRYLREDPQWEKDAAHLAGCYEDSRRALRDAFQQLPARALVLKDPDWEGQDGGFPDLSTILLNGCFSHLVTVPVQLDQLLLGPGPCAELWSALRSALRVAWKEWAQTQGKNLPAVVRQLESRENGGGLSDREQKLLKNWRIYCWVRLCREYPEQLSKALSRVFDETWRKTGLEAGLHAYDRARSGYLDARSALASEQADLAWTEQCIVRQQREQTRLTQHDQVQEFLQQQKTALRAQVPKAERWFRTQTQPDFPAIRERKEKIFSALRRVAEAILQPDKKHKSCAFHSYVSSEVRQRLPYGCGIEQRYKSKGSWDASLPQPLPAWLEQEQGFHAERLGAEVALAAAANATCSCKAGDAMRSLQWQVGKLARFLDTPECLAQVERVEGAATDYLKELIDYVKGFRVHFYGEHLYRKLLAMRFNRLYLQYVEDLLEILQSVKSAFVKWADGKLTFRSGTSQTVTLLRTPPLPPEDGIPWFAADFLAGLEDPVRRVEAMLMVVEVNQVLRKPRPAIKCSLDELKALFKSLMDENAVRRWQRDTHWLDFCDKFICLANQLLMSARPADASGNAGTLLDLAIHIGLVSGTDNPQSTIVGPALAPFEAVKRALAHKEVHTEYEPAGNEVNPWMRALNTVVKAGKLPKRIANALRAALDGKPNVSSGGEAILGGAVALGAAVSLFLWWKTEQASLRDNLSAVSDVLTIAAAAEDIVGCYRQIALAKQIAKRLPTVTPEAARWAAETALGKRWLLRFGLQTLGVAADVVVFWIDVVNFRESFEAGYYQQAVGQGVNVAGSGLVMTGTSIGTFCLVATGMQWFTASAGFFSSSTLLTLGTMSAWCLGLGVGLIILGLAISWWKSEGSAQEKDRKHWLRGMGSFTILDPAYVIIDLHQGLRSKKFDTLARTSGSVRLLLEWPGQRKTLHARFMDSDSDGDDDVVPYDGQDSFTVTTDDFGHVYLDAQKLQAGLYAQAEGVFGSYADLYLELSEDDRFAPGSTWYSKYWSCELQLSGSQATISKAREQDYAGVDAR